MPVQQFFWIIPEPSFWYVTGFTLWVQAQPVWGAQLKQPHCSGGFRLSQADNLWGVMGMTSTLSCSALLFQPGTDTAHAAVGLFPERVLQGEPGGQTSFKTRPHLIMVTSNCCHVCLFLLYWLTITVTHSWLFPKIQELTANIFKICFPLNTQRRWRTIRKS